MEHFITENIMEETAMFFKAVSEVNVLKQKNTFGFVCGISTEIQKKRIW